MKLNDKFINVRTWADVANLLQESKETFAVAGIAMYPVWTIKYGFTRYCRTEWCKQWRVLCTNCTFHSCGSAVKCWPSPKTWGLRLRNGLCRESERQSLVSKRCMQPDEHEYMFCSVPQFGLWYRHLSRYSSLVVLGMILDPTWTMEEEKIPQLPSRWRIYLWCTSMRLGLTARNLEHGRLNKQTWEIRPFVAYVPTLDWEKCWSSSTTENTGRYEQHTHGGPMCWTIRVQYHKKEMFLLWGWDEHFKHWTPPPVQKNVALLKNCLRKFSKRSYFVENRCVSERNLATAIHFMSLFKIHGFVVREIGTLCI